jgi:hypothetical protein
MNFKEIVEFLSTTLEKLPEEQQTDEVKEDSNFVFRLPNKQTLELSVHNRILYSDEGQPMLRIPK